MYVELEGRNVKKILMIGSVVVDVVINLHHLPATGEDVHVIAQKMSLGGCAYNATDMVRHFRVPHVLFAPVGTGTYGDYIRKHLAERGISTPIPTPDMDNGCCYCFVEHTGERTFISHHGAEYLFYPEWFDLLDAGEFDSAYLCGLEVEERTGEAPVAFLEAHPNLQVYFAPGPRIMEVPRERMERVLDLKPVLHLNEGESLRYTGEKTVEAAAMALHRRTGRAVIVTLGEKGAYLAEDGAGILVPGVAATQVDTIGAGDAHIGAVMACRQLGCTFAEAVARANRAAAAVVEAQGALLPEERFLELGLPVFAGEA